MKTENLDVEVPGGVYLCQVSDSVSCAACCGIYNIGDPSYENIESILRRRNQLFKTVPRDADSLEAYARLIEETEPDERPFEEFHHCPYLGFIGTEEKTVGCLAHPQGRGNVGVDLRGVSYYGGFACISYFCPTCSALSTVYKTIAQAAAKNWYIYGLVITEAEMINCFLGSAEERLGEMLDPETISENPSALKAVNDFFLLKTTWPFREKGFNRIGHYFFKEPVNLRERIDYTALGCASSAFSPIFEALGSSFKSMEDVEQAESIIEESRTQFLDAL
ncbi:MAG: hypothetical protein GY866_17695 [Proteobacteria bacterium]|nr:hypothetical protein [Pseudomonadota bacterium]